MGHSSCKGRGFVKVAREGETSCVPGLKGETGLHLANGHELRASARVCRCVCGTYLGRKAGMPVRI